MKQNNELEKMKRWAHGLDIGVNVMSIIGQFVCVMGAVLFIAMNFLAIVPDDNVSMDLRILGHQINFNSVSPTGQTVIILLLAVVCILAFFMIRDLSKALHNVFQPMTKGRPFEEDAVKGFRRAAIWCVIIAVLTMNLSVLAIAALLLLLSYVFHYGAILQTESDETL